MAFMVVLKIKYLGYDVYSLQKSFERAANRKITLNQRAREILPITESPLYIYIFSRFYVIFYDPYKLNVIEFSFLWL